jgi:SAM-dependent methyltransferase
MEHSPPLDLATESFDVVYATSIFTHYTWDEESEWLNELWRVLRPGGLLLATTLSPGRIVDFPATAKERDVLGREGFVCLNPTGQFNERATFISIEHLDRSWASRFSRIAFEERGFLNYQDLGIWRRE